MESGEGCFDLRAASAWTVSVTGEEAYAVGLTGRRGLLLATDGAVRIDGDPDPKTNLVSSEPKEPMPMGSGSARWPLVVVIVGVLASLVWAIALVWLAIRLIS
jgi:hypothetical protein